MTNQSQTQVLQKMQELYKLASEGVSKQDFLTSFQNVVALITKINKEMIKRQDDSFVQITAQFKALEKEVKSASKDDFGALKTDLVSKVNTALKEQTNGMKFIYDRVAEIENGEKGEDGKTPTRDELIALITPLIPQAIAPQEVDIDAIVEQVLEKVAGRVPKYGAHIFGGGKGFQLQVGGTKKGLAQYLNLKAGSNTTLAHTNVNGVQTITIASTGGGGGFSTLDATETPNGNLTVFTFAGAGAQPTYLVVDNVWMKATSKAGTVNWTWNGVSLKATLSEPAQDDIFAIV